jgi:hypothetical protein
VTHLVWAGVVVFALVRGERVLRDWWAHRYPPVALTEQDVVVPDDIVALAMRESEEWAQEQVLQTAKERYVKVQDASMPDAQKWNLVRRALGIGELG